MLVPLSLLVGMLRAKMHEALVWALTAHGKPHRHFPHQSCCCPCSGPCGSYHGRRTHLSSNQQGTFKELSLLLTGLGGNMACHTERPQLPGRKRGRELGPRGLPLLGLR